jgi:hypothetical protein
MNYYAQRYTDEYDSSNTNIYFSIVEGVYESKNKSKAREIGILNITTRTFYKYVKQPYDVIDIGENTITLNMARHNKTYTLLSTLLASEGCTSEQIAHIFGQVSSISNNKTIRTNQPGFGVGEWITLE